MLSDVRLKESDERWYLCQSFIKCIKCTVCVVPCLGVDSWLVRDVAGGAEAVTVLAVIHPAPLELPAPSGQQYWAHHAVSVLEPTPADIN